MPLPACHHQRFAPIAADLVWEWQETKTTGPGAVLAAGQHHAADVGRLGHDGVNTVEMGEAAFEGLGSPDADKGLVVFEQSEPFVEEPDLFLESVHAFVDRN